MITTETIDAILAACRKCVELGENPEISPKPWNTEGINIVCHCGDVAETMFRNDAAFIAHACNIGVAACKSLILAIEALRSMSTDSISADAAEACEHPINAANALESIAQTWRSAV